MTIKRSLSRVFASCLALAACVAITACAAFTGTPDANQVAAIQSACAIDAGLRPTVTLLAASLATPAENEALAAAHAIIDPVCANPAGSVQTNTLTVFTEATAQVANILADLQARKSKVVAASAG